MNQRNWIILAVVVLILIIGYIMWPSPDVGSAPDTAETTEPAEETTD